MNVDFGDDRTARKTTASVSLTDQEVHELLEPNQLKLDLRERVVGALAERIMERMDPVVDRAMDEALGAREGE